MQKCGKTNNEDSLREQEAAILKLGSLYSKHGKAEGIHLLLRAITICFKLANKFYHNMILSWLLDFDIDI